MLRGDLSDGAGSVILHLYCKEEMCNSPEIPRVRSVHSRTLTCVGLSHILLVIAFHIFLFDIDFSSLRTWCRTLLFIICLSIKTEVLLKKGVHYSLKSPNAMPESMFVRYLSFVECICLTHVHLL